MDDVMRVTLMQTTCPNYMMSVKLGKKTNGDESITLPRIAFPQVPNNAVDIAEKVET